MISAPASSARNIIALLQEKPLDPELWQQLLAFCQAKRDTASVPNLEVILAGLNELKRCTGLARSQHQKPPPPTPLAAPLFARLASSHNDLRLLREAGIIYLSVWHLPECALQHFECCRRLGEPERFIGPLIEAAQLAMERKESSRPASNQGNAAGAPLNELLRNPGLLTPPGARVPVTGGLLTRKKEGLADLPLPKSTIECVREAFAIIPQGRLARARALLVRAAESPRLDDELGAAWALLGKAHFDAGSHSEMEQAYEQALRFEPQSMIAHFNLALARQLNQRLEEAEAFYLAADRLEPDHPKVWCNLGSLYFQTNRYPASEAALRRALAADPGYARAWDNLASILSVQNRLNESLEACRRAIAIRPDYPEAHFKMGVIYFGKNLLTEAVEAFRHAAADPPLAPFAYALLATIQARLHQTIEAEASVRHAVELEPKCPLIWTAWNELGKAHQVLQNYPAAVAAFQEATALKPEEFESWLNLGLARHLLGDRAQAREAYRQSVRLRPESIQGWHSLGVVCAELQLPREATEAFQAELRLKPDHAPSWHALGVTLQAEGRQDEAQNAFHMAEVFQRAGVASAA